MPLRHAHRALVLALLATTALHAQRRTADLCQPVVPLTGVPGLREGSSLASGRLTPRLFASNDSDTPELVMLDDNGVPTGRILVRNATVEDWEDLTSSRCTTGPCLFIGDIGDNQLSRTSITLYQVPEPRDGQREVTAQRFELAYPDGPHDAEAMFAGPDGRLYLLTKEARAAELYALPQRLAVGGRNRLTHLRRLSAGSGRNAFARITDAESTPDGRTVAVRSNDAVFVLPTAALLDGNLAGASAFSLRGLGEPQGEGVSFADNGDLFLLGESGSRRDVGTFARVACTPSAP